MVKIARSETFQMSIDWLPERRLLSEWRYETVPIEPPPLRGGLWQLHLAWMPATGRRLWDRRSRPLFGQPRRIQVCSCSRFTRLLLVQLIFLVTDRSRNHGYAP